MPVTTLELVANELYPTRVIPPVPVGPPKPTGGRPDLGTVDVFSDVLRHHNDGRWRALRYMCACPRAEQWFCHAGWDLKGVKPKGAKKMTGGLASGGLIDYTLLPQFDVAIFGGTGGFAGVVGEIHGEYVAPATQYEFTFEIVP